MTAFNDWYKNIENEYPMFQDKDGYNIGNTRALKVGWKAALKWIEGVNDNAAYNDVDQAIYEELKEE